MLDIIAFEINQQQQNGNVMMQNEHAGQKATR